MTRFVLDIVHNNSHSVFVLSFATQRGNAHPSLLLMIVHIVLNYINPRIPRYRYEYLSIFVAVGEYSHVVFLCSRVGGFIYALKKW